MQDQTYWPNKLLPLIKQIFMFQPIKSGWILLKVKTASHQAPEKPLHQIAWSSLQIIILPYPYKTFKSFQAKHFVFPIANPEAVPAGEYAKHYFQSKSVDGKNLWESLLPKVAPASNVRAALAMVESDPSVIGIVYKTDATASKKAKIIFEIPPQETPRIEYAAAQIKKRKGTIAHNHFLRFLTNPKAQEIFAAHGFLQAPILTTSKPKK